MTERGISHTILSYERPEMLSELVHELQAEIAASGEQGQIVIVDDGSKSHEQRHLLDCLEERGVVVLRKDHDLMMPESWARNVSRGLRAGRYDILFHWDDDTRVRGDGGWSHTIAKKLRDHPELGTLCPVRTGIMEPMIPTPQDYLLSFGLTEPCFAFRRHTFETIGDFDEELRWFYGPDYSLRIMNAGLECAFDVVGKQIDLQIRAGMPQDTFPRASGAPYFEKWTSHYGTGEHDWPPFIRHRDRLRRGAR